MRNGRTTRIRRWGFGLLSMALAGCGNLTAGGVGEAVVVVSGDADDPASIPASMQSARVETAWGGDPRRSDDSPEGRIEAEMLFDVVTEDGTVLPLYDDEFEVSVDLEGVEQDETLPRRLPADRYAQLRIVFLQIEVRVDAGLVIEGDTITGPIDIELEGDSLVVLKPLALDLGDRESVEILVDLNASQWLQAVDPSSSSVDATVFAELIAVSVR